MGKGGAAASETVFRVCLLQVFLEPEAICGEWKTCRILRDLGQTEKKMSELERRRRKLEQLRDFGEKKKE